jgi:hypothetical protein
MNTARIAIAFVATALVGSVGCSKGNGIQTEDAPCQAYLSCLTAIASTGGAATATYQAELVSAQALYGPTGMCGSSKQAANVCASSCSQALSVAASAFPTVAACGGGLPGDGGNHPADMSMAKHDFSFSSFDFSGSDLSANGSCTQVGAWPSITNSIGAFFTPDIDGAVVDDSIIQAVDPTANAEGNYDILFVEVDVPHGAPPAYPQTATYTTSTTLDAPPTIGNASSTASIFLYANYDLSTTDGGAGVEFYVAQGGTATFTRVDDDATGTMTTSGSTLHFVQWPASGTPDTPLANGKCYDVASYSLSAVYTPQADGGT